MVPQPRKLPIKPQFQDLKRRIESSQVGPESQRHRGEAILVAVYRDPAREAGIRGELRTARTSYDKCNCDE